MTDEPKQLRAPAGLAAGGRALWRGITSEHPVLDSQQIAQLTEVCRAKDRLDQLDRVLRGDLETWARLVPDPNDEQVLTLVINGALDKANATANTMKQLIAALRLPDEITGKRPQQRGPRVVKPQQPGGAGKPVSSLERARQRRSS